VVVEATQRPRGPYSLAVSARLSSDATRRFRDRTLTAVHWVAGRPERVSASQRSDGTLVLRAPSEEAFEGLRFVLACDDDHSEFLRRFAGDRLLAGPIRHLRGLRRLRTATVTQALLRAVAGQLIKSSEAREIERRLIRATTPPHLDLHAPPLPKHLGRFSPPELQRFDLPSRKASAIVRLCRTLDVERLRRVPTDAVVKRLGRERGIGPWSIGVICLEGLGRTEHGLVGDLGLLKLCSAIHGRWVEAEETAELLARYEEWAGLACVYLMAGAARGLVPIKLSTPQVRRARIRARYAA
jgi:3-methyladenine DNA glycosylase/8-oxoguanine DNA glycosylase